ncbi:MAG: hypothetical protein K6T83_08295 [Alicyclobacillus sp.]|nr:hypothetical protein [Alicyclobacillus sp.]
MFQCPICGELLEALTNVHCVSRHQATKREVLAQHGAPKYVTPQMNRDVQKWIRESQIITRMDFEVAQASARNQYRKRP